MLPAEGPAGEPVALWSRLYPVFPAVLVVLAGRGPETGSRIAAATVLALCRQDPDLAETPEVEVSICLLDDLVERGPFAPICRTLADARQAGRLAGGGGRLMAGPRAAGERPRPFGLPVLRADERFVDALAETVAEQVVDRLRGGAAETDGYLNPEAAGPLHLASRAGASTN